MYVHIPNRGETCVHACEDWRFPFYVDPGHNGVMTARVSNKMCVNPGHHLDMICKVRRCKEPGWHEVTMPLASYANTARGRFRGVLCVEFWLDARPMFVDGDGGMFYFFEVREPRDQRDWVAQDYQLLLQFMDPGYVKSAREAMESRGNCVDGSCPLCTGEM